jgi:hypothetical protein
MEIMDILDVWKPLKILDNLADVKFTRSSFHQDFNALLDNFSNCEENDYRKDISTDWICQSPGWLKVNNN